jgi:outer membrane protein OmpA-like peptidoglycan-associated protein
MLVVLAGACLLAGGCATKSFVRKEMQKSEQKVGKELAQQQEVLSRQEARVGTVEATIRQDQERIGQVATRAEATEGRLVRLWTNRNKRELVETVVIPFGFDKWELDDRGETTLLEVVKELAENPNLFVDLEGYTDPTGPRSYNLELSHRRVEAVRRFLVGKGVDLPRIQVIGLGPANPIGDNKTTEGRRQNRRVALKLFTQVE